MWFYRRRRARKHKPTKHYLTHKEMARAFVHERLAVFSAQYGFAYKRVFIKNQKSCWGSCSEHGNLNFNYKLVFLPAHLADYVIVHELCHLAELNHSPRFWSLVARACPAYKQCRKELQTMPMRGLRVRGVHYAYGRTTLKTA